MRRPLPRDQSEACLPASVSCRTACAQPQQSSLSLFLQRPTGVFIGGRAPNQLVYSAPVAARFLVHLLRSFAQTQRKRRGALAD